MDEEKSCFPEYKLNFFFVLGILPSSNTYYYSFNNKDAFLDISLNDLYLVVSNNTIYFYFDHVDQLILLDFQKSSIVIMDTTTILYYITPVSTIFPNVSQDQWSDLIEHNYPLMENMIESYFNELIKLETKTNLEKYENSI